MSRKHNRPEWHEPAEVVVVEVIDPIEDTIEVGEVVLIDGPLDPVPLNTHPRASEGYDPPRHSAGPMPDLHAAGAGKGETEHGMKDKAQDIIQGAAQQVQDVGSKAQDRVQDVTQKAQDAATGVADKAQDVTQKVAEKASTVKAAAGEALDSVKSTVPAAKGVLGNAAGKIGAASATGAQSAGMALWTLFQRNPLQALFVIAGLIWLYRSNKAAASQPPVSLNDAAEQVGTVAGHVQVAATNLSSQMSEQASRGAGWFTRTLQENPLAIGAMAIVFGAGLGFAVPETPYENGLLGKKRDELADKVQAAAQDLTQKVTTVAQSAVHEAVETAKEEAKNQGLTAEALPGQPQAEADGQHQAQSQEQSPAS